MHSLLVLMGSFIRHLDTKIDRFTGRVHFLTSVLGTSIASSSLAVGS